MPTFQNTEDMLVWIEAEYPRGLAERQKLIEKIDKPDNGGYIGINSVTEARRLDILTLGNVCRKNFAMTYWYFKATGRGIPSRS